MKKIFSIFCFSFLMPALQAQNVSIPDVNFFNALIAAGVDTSGDNVIQIAEALAVTQISVGSMSISSLKGIEAFTNLTSLICPINSLTSIDVTKNTSLQYFDIGGNYTLTKLDLSKNTSLITLDIIFTGLTSIDLSNNLLLQGLYCNGTVYSGLTLNNSLKWLDVSKNTLLTSLSAEMNPQLKTICVNPDQLANKVAGWSKDPGCVWDTVCTPPVTPTPPVVPVTPVTPVTPVVPVIPISSVTSVTEVESQTFKPLIIRSFDILGNEINPNTTAYRGIIILQFSDGTTKKIVKID